MIGGCARLKPGRPNADLSSHAESLLLPMPPPGNAIPLIRRIHTLLATGPGIPMNLGKERLIKARTFVEKVLEHSGQDNVPRLAAAFSFYAILSLAPMLVLGVTAAGWILGRDAASGSFLSDLPRIMGPQAGSYVAEMIKDDLNHHATGWWASGFSLAVTFFAASNLALQFNDAMNTIWRVQEKGSVIRVMVKTRILAFLGVLVFGGITVAWLLFDSWTGWLVRQTAQHQLVPYLSLLAAVLFLTCAFAISIRAYTHGRAAWRDILPGAIIGASGVAIFKLILSEFLVRGAAVSAYGAAGSLVAVLLWIYYTAMVYFYGVEVSYAFSESRKAKTVPSDAK